MIKSKLPNVKTTIFTTMSAMANEQKAINLSQGFPNFPVNKNLLDLVKKYYTNGYNQYAPMQGFLGLREAIANQFKSKYNITVNPSTEITITAGATQAIFTAITSIISNGDEVIYFTPAYDCYAPAVELNNGVPIEIPLTKNFNINWEEVEQKISDKTKLIIINTPHNPSGNILQKEDLEKLQKLVAQKNIFVLSDEVYEHIVFDNQTHESALKYEELRKKSFVTFSFGKSLHATGWKLGYCVAPESLTTEFRKVHQYNVFCCNTPTQHAIADYINNHSPFDDISNMYQEKRDLFLSYIKDSRFTPIPCKGTYFQLLSYQNISNDHDVEFAKTLTKKHQVASIPISVFYGDNRDHKILRFCFAKDNDTLKRAAEKLCKI